MVCLDSRGPENAALLRYASRLAGRLNRNWYAVYVQTLGEEPTVIDATRQRLLADTLTLANQLGATVFTLKANDVADALARFAREYRVGHVIVGRPHQRPWWRRLLRRGEVVPRLLKKGDGFTLTLIDTRAGSPGRAPVEEEPAPATAAPKPAERLKLTTFLGSAQVRIWEEPVTKDQALRELVRTVAADRPGLDAEALLRRLEERESQGSTFLNEGVALPHARIDGLDRPLVALGLSHGGILDAYTENPIEAVFLLLSPKDENRSHLQLLAVAGRMMLNRTLRNDLRRAPDPDAAFQRLTEFENPG
jgi:two-component system sensor histidine kinase KdpD